VCKAPDGPQPLTGPKAGDSQMFLLATAANCKIDGAYGSYTVPKPRDRRVTRLIRIASSRQLSDTYRLVLLRTDRHLNWSSRMDAHLDSPSPGVSRKSGLLCLGFVSIDTFPLLTDPDGKL